jgi:tetratricopeptide (TPR) repeat protein
MRTLGKKEEETRILTQLLNDAATAHNASMQARVYTEWGNLHYHRGEFNRATENYLRAFTMAGQARDSIQEVSILSRLAQSYERTGARSEAFQTFTDALVRADRAKGSDRFREEMLIRIGNIYLGSSQFDDAERFYSAALQSAGRRNDKLIEGYLWIQLGHCVGGKDPRSPDARKNYQIALDLFTTASYPPGIRYARASFGFAARKSGKAAEALEFFKAAMQEDPYPGSAATDSDIPLECENAFYRLQGAGLNETYLEALLVAGKYAEAFVEADRERATRLARVAGSLSLETKSQETTAAVWEAHKNEALEQGALRQLGILLSTSSDDHFAQEEARGQRERYSAAARKARERLAEIGNGPTNLLVSREGTTIGAIQSALRDDTYLFTHIPTTRSIFIFVIGKRSWTVELSPVPRSRLTELESEYLSLIVDRRADSVQAEAKSMPQERRLNEVSAMLYGALIWPVESFMARDRRLVVVPFERTIPVHSLRKTGRRSRFLIQDFQVSYLPTSALVFHQQVPAPGPVDIVGLGHQGRSSWDVEYELRDIRAFHKEARLHFGRQATIPTLQKEHASVLNLAAEFHFDAQQPGNSFVRFSNGAQDGSAEFPWGRMLSLPRFPAVLISDLGTYEDLPTVKPMLFLVNGSESVILTSSPPQRKTKKYFGEFFYTAITAGRSSDEAYRDAVVGMIGNPDTAPVPVWGSFFRWGI